MDNRIQKGLDEIRDRLYRDQPDTMGAVSDLLDLLSVAFCNHKWITRYDHGPNPETPPDAVVVCEDCGAEKEE